MIAVAFDATADVEEVDDELDAAAMAEVEVETDELEEAPDKVEELETVGWIVEEAALELEVVELLEPNAGVVEVVELPIVS